MSKRPDLRYERRLWKLGIDAVAGVDEAGVGPMAGPVIAAAVVFAPETFISGVHDSKQLTHEQREELFTPIRDRAIAVGVGVNSSSRCSWVNCLESCTPLMNISGAKTTAAATTGPAIGPTPASSTPATASTPSFHRRRS